MATVQKRKPAAKKAPAPAPKVEEQEPVEEPEPPVLAEPEAVPEPPVEDNATLSMPEPQNAHMISVRLGLALWANGIRAGNDVVRLCGAVIFAVNAPLVSGGTLDSLVADDDALKQKREEIIGRMLGGETLMLAEEVKVASTIKLPEMESTDVIKELLTVKTSYYHACLYVVTGRAIFAAQFMLIMLQMLQQRKSDKLDAQTLSITLATRTGQTWDRLQKQYADMIPVHPKTPVAATGSALAAADLATFPKPDYQALGAAAELAWKDRDLEVMLFMIKEANKYGARQAVLDGMWRSFVEQASRTKNNQVKLKALIDLAVVRGFTMPDKPHALNSGSFAGMQEFFIDCGNSCATSFEGKPVDYEKKQAGMPATSKPYGGGGGGSSAGSTYGGAKSQYSGRVARSVIDDNESVGGLSRYSGRRTLPTAVQDLQQSLDTFEDAKQDAQEARDEMDMDSDLSETPSEEEELDEYGEGFGIAP